MAVCISLLLILCICLSAFAVDVLMVMDVGSSGVKMSSFLPSGERCPDMAQASNEFTVKPNFADAVVSKTDKNAAALAYFVKIGEVVSTFAAAMNPKRLEALNPRIYKVAMATAGNRIIPKPVDSASWTYMGHFCSAIDPEVVQGCSTINLDDLPNWQTLPGTSEAKLEYLAVVDAVRNTANSDFSIFLSTGGSSAQMGFVLDVDQEKGFRRAMKQLESVPGLICNVENSVENYMKVETIGGRKVGLVSFLAGGNCDKRNTHKMGGWLETLRAFDGSMVTGARSNSWEGDFRDQETAFKRHLLTDDMLIIVRDFWHTYFPDTSAMLPAGAFKFTVGSNSRAKTKYEYDAADKFGRQPHEQLLSWFAEMLEDIFSNPDTGLTVRFTQSKITVDWVVAVAKYYGFPVRCQVPKLSDGKGGYTSENDLRGLLMLEELNMQINSLL